MIRNYSRRKVNSIIQSKYVIEKDLYNLECLIRFNLNKVEKTNIIHDEFIQEILSVSSEYKI